MNYKKLGLKVGLEIHQQLAGQRLFCGACSSILQEGDPDVVVKRKLYAVAGELGAVDPAALQAQLRGMSYVYNFYNKANCLVEIDEEPPCYSNETALDTAIEIALLLNSKVVDELHIMRKTVIDGSNPSGFQRTVLVAMNGKLKHNGTEISIPTICMEEDAGRIIDRNENEITYNLDRLGIPLIEIVTAPEITSPGEAKEIAGELGAILRATGKAKRGIGTIRQDLNVSIKEGARVEVKGVQELNLLPKVVENEVKRQLSLLGLVKELKGSGVKKISTNPIGISGLFKNTESSILRKCLEKKEEICALKLEKFSGIPGKELIPGRRFGTELAEYAKAYGANGLMHSDELPGYGVSKAETEGIKKKLGAKEEDAFILISHPTGACKPIMDKLIERVNYALEGVPGETRKALPDGSSAYMRPLPGKARMYPETDLVPIVVTEKRLADLRKKLPKLPWLEVKELCSKYKLSPQLAKELYNSEHFELFKKLTREIKADPGVIASTLVETLRSVESGEVELSYMHYMDLFANLSKGTYSKEALPGILEKWLKEPDKKLDTLVKELGLAGISKAELGKMISKIVEKNKGMIKEKKERAIKPLMGLVMKEVRGKADGKLVMDILKEKVKKEL